MCLCRMCVLFNYCYSHLLSLSALSNSERFHLYGQAEKYSQELESIELNTRFEKKKQILKLAHFTFPWLCRMCNTRFFVPGLTKHSFILSCTNCRTTILSFYQSTPTTEKGQTIPYLHQLRTSVGKSNNKIILSDYSTIAFLIEYTF